MADDILDAAQKAINDAAKVAGTPPSDAGSSVEPVVPPPPPPLPPEPLPDPVVSPQTTTPSATEPITPASPVPTPPPTPPSESAQVMDSILETGSTTVVPPVNQPPHTNKPLPKKSGVKGIVLGLIALLLLTIPVAVYYISKQNESIADTRSSAYGACASAGECIQQSTNNICCQGTTSTNDPSCGTVPVRCVAAPTTPPGIDCGDGTHCAVGQTCHCEGGQNCTSYTCWSEVDIRNRCTDVGRSWCQNSENTNDNGYTCCAEGYVCATRAPWGCVRSTDGGGGDNPTPTTPPTIPVCQNIKVYKDGAQVTDLTTLRAGNDVILAVKGNLGPTKAHFRVNGGAWTETTTKNRNDEFTWEYTIPEGVTQFQIEGEVFTNGAWH